MIFIRELPRIFSIRKVFSFRNIALIFTSVALLTVTGCAKRPPASNLEAVRAYKEANDPLEPMNRAIFTFNQKFDRHLLKPVAEFYRQFGPPKLRKGVANFVRNWREPVTFINDVLQAKMSRAGITLSRFLINSTFGLLGILDTATYWGIKGHKEDFGETFADWGVGNGVYLMLPFLGPSNSRDVVGLTVELLLDPVSLWLNHKGWAYISYGRLALRGLIYREENLGTLDDLSKSSADFYATIRSAYRQNRAYKINNGVLNVNADDDLFDEDSGN